MDEKGEQVTMKFYANNLNDNMNSDTNWVKIIFILIQKWQHYTLGKICDMLVR